jgi:hypothetical protein
MSRALDQANKYSYQQVRFTYGDTASPTRTAYTNWTSTISGTPDFESTPTMVVTLPDNNGTIEKAQVKIRLPFDTFTELITTGLPQSPIYVEIWDRTTPAESGDSATTLKPFTGRVQSAIRFPDGKSNVVDVMATSYKLQLDTPLGIPATHQCQWTYGEGQCKVTRDDQTSGVSISAIDGKKVTLSGLRTVPAFNDRNFHRGYITYDGSWIGIREWRDTDYNTIYLVTQPPASWVGKGIKIYAGCDKTIESCRTRPVSSGEQYFMGCGFSIPSYNPIIENGG